MRKTASKQRFAEYLKRLRAREKQLESADGHVPPSFHGSAERLHVRNRSTWRLLCAFWQVLAGHRAVLVAALATLSISTLLKLVPPAVSKIVIDYVLPGRELPPSLAAWAPSGAKGLTLLAMLAGAVVAVSFGSTLVNVLGRWLSTRTTKRVQIELRRRVFEHAVRLPLHRVYELKSGGVASLLREDAGGVGDLIFSLIYNPWRAIIQLLGSLVVLAWVDWRLLAGSLLVIPAIYLTHRTWIVRIRPQYREIRRQRQEIDSHATEAFGGMRVVRAFRRSRSEANRFTRGGNLMARHELLAWWWSRTIEIVWEIMLPLASAALLLYGGSEVLQGRLSVGDLMMFLVYLAMLLGPLAVLAESATALQNNLAGLDRVLDLLDEPREMPDRAGAIALGTAEVRGHLRFRGVSFHYPGSERLVLCDVELDVQPGQMVALVGPSGAGKTTLTNLIARFYDPTSGALELDGVDADIRLEDYRNLLGIVEQDIFLFDGTVAENIGYSRRDATPAQIEDAARVANAHEFIEKFSNGYQTIVGERGVKLSGGQRQRLAIARAVLADPRIFILDEATSNLDTHSERLIQQTLRDVLRDRTSFVIAHRLSTILHADLIVVIDEGRIVESGTHDELMALAGRYRAMVQLQMAGQDVLAGRDWS